MGVRALANWMVIITVLQLIQAVAIGWTAVEIASLRHELDMYTSSRS
jgi:hypothetical protein